VLGLAGFGFYGWIFWLRIFACWFVALVGDLGGLLVVWGHDGDLHCNNRSSILSLINWIYCNFRKITDVDNYATTPLLYGYISDIIL
jgi:hypothetical protein